MSQLQTSSTVVDLMGGFRQCPAFDMQSDFFDALSAGDVDNAVATFSPDGELLFPGLRPVRGRALIKRMLGIIRRRYIDIVWQSSRAPIQSAEWIVMSWEVAGTFRDSALYYQNEGVSIIKLDASGKIAMLSDYFKDTLAFQPGGAAIASQKSRVTQASAV